MYSFFKETRPSQISQSNCINLPIYKMCLEVSVSDALAAKIVVRPQNPWLPLVWHHLGAVLVHSCLACFCDGVLHIWDCSMFPLSCWFWMQELSVSSSTGEMWVVETCQVWAESCVCVRGAVLIDEQSLWSHGYCKDFTEYFMVLLTPLGKESLTSSFKSCSVFFRVIVKCKQLVVARDYHT